MQPLIDFFSIKDLIPHGYCLSWSPVLLWLHVISDLLITLAYYSIPLTLVYFIRQRKDFPYPWLVALFAGFIVACGTTHLLSALTIWIPIYWLDGLVKSLTAIISLVSATLMLWVIPRTLSLPSAAQLQAEIQQRKSAEDALRISENKLATVLDNVEAIIYIKDCNYQYQYANQQLRKLFGKELEGIIGQLDDAFFDETTAAKLYENDRRVIELGERIAIEETTTDKNETTPHTYLSVKQPLRYEDGSIYGLCGVSTDISERKQAEDTLRHSQMELQEAQRIAHVGSWQMDMVTNHVVWSEELYRMLGLNPGLPVADYAEHHRLFTPESWESLRAILSRTKEAGEPYELELEMIRTDGRHGWMLARGEAIRDGSGVITGLHGVAMDITERKSMEEALKASEARFRSVIDVSPIPMALTDEQLNIIFLNPVFVQTFGYGIEDIPTLADWYLKAYPDPDYRHRVEAACAQTYEQAEQGQADSEPLEAVIHCKDNSIKTVLVSIAAIHHNSASLYLVLLYDITQRKQMEAKLNAIFDASVEGIITYDNTDTIISANTAVATIFGYKPEELIGRSICNLMPSYCSLPETAKTAGHIREIEGIHKNGSVVPLDLSVAEYSINDTHYFTNIVRDVSLRKHREQQDKEHLNELAHVTRLGLMGEMASGIAHEVNQPLCAISSYTQASLNLINKDNPDPVKLAEILYKTQQQALRAGQIIHRMRDFVKFHTKYRSTTDINTLIHNAVSLCIAELKQNNIKLTFELEDNLPPVYVDQIQIEQVIINLVRNSIDALQNLIVKQQRHLSIHSLLTPDKGIEVRVKDNGLGFDEDQRQKILTPFYTTKKNGMGMGLSISRSLIEAHEGTLYFDSKPGKGSTFYFTLPI